MLAELRGAKPVKTLGKFFSTHHASNEKNCCHWGVLLVSEDFSVFGARERSKMRMQKSATGLAASMPFAESEQF